MWCELHIVCKQKIHTLVSASQFDIPLTPCASIPISFSFSNNSTWWPASASMKAVARPDIPEPMMAIFFFGKFSAIVSDKIDRQKPELSGIFLHFNWLKIMLFTTPYHARLVLVVLYYCYALPQHFRVCLVPACILVLYCVYCVYSCLVLILIIEIEIETLLFVI